MGCESGSVYAWDTRQPTFAGVVTTSSENAGLEAAPVTHVAADKSSGLILSAGTKAGQVALYDLRKSVPLLVKDHMNSQPIVKTYFFEGEPASDGFSLGSGSTAGSSRNVVSADTGGVKIWDKNDGKNFTAVECPAEVYDFTFFRRLNNLAAPFQCADSGVICIACDTSRVQVHFIPQLAPAPRWSSFLESITEEMEEKETNVVYEDYKFVSQEELNRLGLKQDAVDKGLIRPAMHGAYIQNRTYKDLCAVLDDRTYQQVQQEQKQQRIQRRTGQRISKFEKVQPEKVVPEGGSVAAVMSSMTPEALELLANDPRFKERLHTPAFSKGKGKKQQPNFDDDTNFSASQLKVFERLDIERKKVAERRQKYDAEQFVVVKPGENGKDSSGDKRPREDKSDADADGVIMAMAQPGTSIMTDKEAHRRRKSEREKKLSIAERLAKMKKTR